jgi:predicted metal-dependent peptidase
MSKLTAEQRVQKVHVWLMKEPKYCLYSGVMMIGTVEVKDNVPTAYTNGRDVKYGREFVDELTDAELKGLVLHENLHKAFRHTTMWRHLHKEHAQLANMACDYVINLMIYDSDTSATHVKLPDGGLLDEQYRGLDAGEVFRRLKEECKRDGGIRVRTVDNQEGKFVPAVDGGGMGGFDEHDWEGAETMSRAEQDKLANDVDQALRQGAILAGKMKGNVPQEVTDALTSKVDWRAVLREFVTSVCQDRDESTWRRPSRRWIGQDVYMPSLIGDSVGRIVIGADMSGSMHSMLNLVLGEIVGIAQTAKPEGIDLLYWDTEVCSAEKYDLSELDSLLAKTKPRGGGGTSPQCVADYIRKNKLEPVCIIMLTDGYVDSWGTGWNAPVLWGITDKDILASSGKTVRIG